MKFIIILSLILCIINCEQPKSNEDKLKSNYKDKPLNLVKDSLYLRMVGGISGDPLCGGDPIGTLLGLNNDIPKPIQLEIGQTYSFEGNPNLVNLGGISQNLFSLSNNQSKDLEIKFTLIENCPSEISTVRFASCEGSILSQYIESSEITCTYNPIIVNLFYYYSSVNSVQVCTAKKTLSNYYLRIYRNQCKYQIEIKEI